MAEVIAPRRVRVTGDLWHPQVPDGAVYVGRQAPGLKRSPYANPFKVGKPVPRESPLFPYAARAVAGFDSSLVAGFSSIKMLTAEQVVEAYGWWFIEQPGLMLNVREDLAGRVLADWCPPSPPDSIRCHADWLVAFLDEEEGDA